MTNLLKKYVHIINLMQIVNKLPTHNLNNFNVILFSTQMVRNHYHNNLFT